MSARPRTIVVALVLIAAQTIVPLALSLPGVALALPGLISGNAAGPAGMLAGIFVVEVLAAAVLFYALYAGHRWARWIVIVFLGYGLARLTLGTLAGYALSAARSVPLPVQTGAVWRAAVSAILDIVVIALLLHPSTAQWYRRSARA